MGCYTGNDKEKVERQRLCEEREGAELRAMEQASDAWRRECAERLVRERAGWHEMRGTRQTRMLVVGAALLLGWVGRRALRWKVVKCGNLWLEVQLSVGMGAIGATGIGFGVSMLVITYHSAPAYIERHAPKCWACTNGLLAPRTS